MSTETETTETRPTAPAPAFSTSDWLRAEVTLTLQRWMLVAAGFAAFVLVLVALD
jgi:hypothetical protein